MVENFADALAKLSFSERLDFFHRMNMSFGNKVSRGVNELLWYGRLAERTYKGVHAGDDEYYVYLWRHAWGDPFYVGSGKNDRWTTIGSRCDDFYLHLDQADSVVYRVLSGVDSKTAHAYEKYVSVNLGRAGYVLANGDNNYEYATESARHRMIEKCDKLVGLELTTRVENAVLGIISDNPDCDYRITDAFLMRHGTDYFSRNYLSGRRKYCCDRA